jgi:3-oxoacyl-(acyl-carrier-protein) synthase
MEANKAEYPQSNYDLILKKAAQSQLTAVTVKQALQAAGINGEQCTRNELVAAIKSVSGNQLTTHEIISLSRRHESSRAVVKVQSLLNAL